MIIQVSVSGPKLSDLNTLSQRKLLENHTFTVTHTYIALILTALF